MHSLKNKRQEIVNKIRKQHKEDIIKKMRANLTITSAFQEQPLISTTLEMFWHLRHFELHQNN